MATLRGKVVAVDRSGVARVRTSKGQTYPFKISSAYGAVRVGAHVTFQPAALSVRVSAFSAKEASRIRSQVSMTLCNLGVFDLYWIPSERKILARSIGCTRSFFVPPGAVLIGRFTKGLSGPEVFAEIEEFLAALPVVAPQPAPLSAAPAPAVTKEEPSTSIAAPRELPPGERLTWAPARFNFPVVPKG